MRLQQQWSIDLSQEETVFMGSYVIDSELFRDQFSTEVSRRIFSDANTVQKWLDIEAALARVQGRLGIIPAEAAAEIERVARVEFLDLASMKREMDRTSHPIVPLLRAIQALCSGNAGEYVHWGATTQDIMDTGTVMQVREILDEIETGLKLVLDHVCTLADRHRSTVMAGRSHGQQALPITFGFKAAGWAAEIQRNLDRLQQMRPRVLIGQFSGAVGTLAALGDQGDAVQRGLMEELGLNLPVITWHTSRDSVAELMCTLAIAASTLGKMAHEVYSLQKTEFAELEEPFSPGKVGSSTMPHKRNPPACEGIVALARVVRASAGLGIETMLADHERDKIVLQMEREFLGRTCCMVDAAVRKTAAVMRGLTVRPDNMRRNLNIQKGLLMSEPVMFALSGRFGKQEAHEMVYELCMTAFEEGTPLKEALLAHPLIGQQLQPAEIDSMLDPSGYTGMAGVFVDRVLERASIHRAGSLPQAAG